MFFGDAALSTMGVMLFPDDLTKAKGFVAQRLTRGPLQEYEAAGYDFGDRRREHYDTLGGYTVTESEVDRRFYDGSLAGETTKCLWALICSHPERASWATAIEIVEKAAGRDRGSASHIRKQLGLFGPALHLWAAWSVRGQEFGPPGEMFAEAGALMIGLREWQAARPRHLRSSRAYLVADEFGPWPDWREPDEYRAPMLSLSADLIPARKSAGRPPK